MEILVVLAIMSLVAMLAIGQVQKVLENARIAAAHMTVTSALKSPLFMFNNHVGSFPATNDGLAALLNAPASARSRWHGPYIERVPLDPWNEPYQYASPGARSSAGYDLWSKGPDKISGTDDDIGNWETAPAAK